MMTKSVPLRQRRRQSEGGSISCKTKPSLIITKAETSHHGALAHRYTEYHQRIFFHNGILEDSVHNRYIYARFERLWALHRQKQYKK